MSWGELKIFGSINGLSIAEEDEEEGEAKKFDHDVGSGLIVAGLLPFESFGRTNMSKEERRLPPPPFSFRDAVQ